MSSVELRRQLIADIKVLPDDKLSSVADYVSFVASRFTPNPNDEDADLYTPESVREILAGRADFEAARCVAWDDIKHRYPPATPKPANRRAKVRAGK